MPRRLIQESCRRSKTLDGLSAEAERLFWRLTTVADDYGRFPADPRELLASCFPLRVGSWKPDRIGRWYGELERADLVASYQSGDHFYGQFRKWKEHQGDPRASKSRYPAPTKDSIESARTCAHMRADAPVVRSSVLRSSDLDLSVTAPKDGAVGVSEFEQFWNTYPKKRAKGDALKAWIALKPSAPLLARILRAVESQRESPDWRKSQGRYIPYPATWLRAQRWEDVLDEGQPEQSESVRRFRESNRRAIEELRAGSEKPEEN